MVINNPIEYQAIMNAKMAVVLNNLTERLLLELKSIIDEEVYSYPNPNGSWDGRTGEFGKSWEASVPELVGGWWESKIDNQAFDFTWNNERDNWSHGNYYEPVESNDDFNEIINNRQGGSDFGFPALRRDFWTPFMAYCEANLETLFKAECEKQGIPIEFSSVFLA